MEWESWWELKEGEVEEKGNLLKHGFFVVLNMFFYATVDAELR